MDMTTNVVNDTLDKPAISFCKKCNLKHEKPVGAKCEKAKAAREINEIQAVIVLQ